MANYTLNETRYLSAAQHFLTINDGPSASLYTPDEDAALFFFASIFIFQHLAFLLAHLSLTS